MRDGRNLAFGQVELPVTHRAPARPDGHLLDPQFTRVTKRIDEVLVPSTRGGLMPAASPLENSARRAAALRLGSRRAARAASSEPQLVDGGNDVTQSDHVVGLYHGAAHFAVTSPVIGSSIGRRPGQRQGSRSDGAATRVRAASGAPGRAHQLRAGSGSRGWQTSQNCRPFVRRDRNVSEGWS